MLEAQPYPTHQRAEIEKKTPNTDQIQVEEDNKELEDQLLLEDQFFSPEEIYI
jgi:hypothetical protein